MPLNLQILHDYKHNIPLHMLSSKYDLPIHELLQILATFILDPTRTSHVIT